MRTQSGAASRLRQAVFAFAACGSAALILAVGTRAAGTPLILPPLGASAYLCILKPTLVSSSPRNTVLGHILGVLCGVAALAVCGLVSVPPDAPLAMDWPRVVATALALGSTCAAMAGLGIEHPPAGATTLIVSFGVCPCGWGLVSYLGGALGLTALARGLHAARDVEYPIWA